jgi:hypothetical protein
MLWLTRQGTHNNISRKGPGRLDYEWSDLEKACSWLLCKGKQVTFLRRCGGEVSTRARRTLYETIVIKAIFYCSRFARAGKATAMENGLKPCQGSRSGLWNFWKSLNLNAGAGRLYRVSKKKLTPLLFIWISNVSVFFDSPCIKLLITFLITIL